MTLLFRVGLVNGRLQLGEAEAVLSLGRGSLRGLVAVNARPYGSLAAALLIFDRPRERPAKTSRGDGKDRYAGRLLTGGRGWNARDMTQILPSFRPATRRTRRSATSLQLVNAG